MLKWLEKLLEPAPDWFYGNFQTGYRSPWTGDHIGRWERHCFRTGRKQMKENDIWVDFEDGDYLDDSWRLRKEADLIMTFRDNFTKEFGRKLL